MKKTILITGSTDGIGKLVASKLAKEGHQVFLHGRNAEKLASVISEIKETTNNSNIDGFVADFSNLTAVKQMAKEVGEKLNELDVLINNAGIFKSPDNYTSDGLDIRFVVNYLAPYVLTSALIPILENSSAPRIINLSSAAQSTVYSSALKGDMMLNVSEAYAQSKLALTMWSFDLAKQLDNVSVIAVNPGSLLNTRMANEAYGHHWSPATKGSDILYDLAISEEYYGKTGKYFDNDKGNPKGTFSKAPPDSYDENKIKILLEITNEIIYS